MALIKCSECGKEISDKAQSCINCGNPIAVFTKPPVLIEQTSKKWKFAKLFSWVMFVIGFFAFLNFFQEDGIDNPATGMAFTIAFFSLIGIVISKFGIWWNHK